MTEDIIQGLKHRAKEAEEHRIAGRNNLADIVQKGVIRDALETLESVREALAHPVTADVHYRINRTLGIKQH